MKIASKIILLFVVISALSACSGGGNIKQQQECSEGLEIANQELEVAKAKGFSGTVALTKAISLLAAAGIQKEFEKYPNCIDKVKRARYYINRAGK
ncbi:MAG: hypothetical protein ABFS08_11545 [Pseudomonadota bacterium]